MTQRPEKLYPIVEIQPHWVIAEEDMGSKPKFWYRVRIPREFGH